MKNYDQAIKEAYAHAGSGLVYLDTFEFANGGFKFYLINALEDHQLTLEDGSQRVFEASAVAFRLPRVGANGIQTLDLAIDNTDSRIMSFVQTAVNSDEATLVRYRPYLSNDFTKPQLDPPLLLQLTDISAKNGVVTARASFADLVNKPLLRQRFTRDIFPTLGN